MIPTKVFNASDVFKIIDKTPLPPGVKIKGYAERDEYVPAVKKYYFDRQELMMMIIWYIEGRFDPFYLFSEEPGSGKSEMVYQFAARLNIPVYQVTMTEGMTLSSIETSAYAKDGSTGYNYGVLPRAMGKLGRPGFCLINEMPNVGPDIWAGMHEVLDGRPHSLATNGNEIIKPVWPFRVIGTGNSTMIMADERGNHPSLYQQDHAFVDRFWKMEKSYPSREIRMQIVKDHVPNYRNVVGTAIVEKMLDVQDEIRKQYKNSELDMTFSVRSLKRWARIAAALTVSPTRFNEAMVFAHTAVANEATKNGIDGIVTAEMAQFYTEKHPAHAA